MRENMLKPRVLVVDDEPVILDCLRLWLKPDYFVHSYSRGEGILSQLDAVEPDLIILDLYMPGMDGFSLCKEIRSDPRFRRLPVVFLTSSKRDADFLKTLELGANAYLNKPITASELRSRIREILKEAGPGRG